ncbi:hypothetical protein A4R35_01665 [Thermogemmatispora tikiterensis]|uniref:ABC-2 type transporter transmembrane domain-containing protein n=1 Tax=Thermogemmatispora tikiterensis TaxID=1825093 RepID=A0A328VBP7_9CHLR|nr:hypothetical protein A4R35_01665 [Thermogemmatispora tikiterensis]
MANDVNYVLPGIFLVAIASGTSYTSLRLFTDVQRGIMERFRSMPIASSTLLRGHVLASLVFNAMSLLVIILVALLMGFRSSAGQLSWLAVVGMLALVAPALTWLAVIPGLTARSIDGAAAFAYPLIFLLYRAASSGRASVRRSAARSGLDRRPVTARATPAPP